MKTASAIVFCFLATGIVSPSWAQMRGASGPIARSSLDAEPAVPAGFWNRLFRPGPDNDERSKRTLPRLDSGPRRLAPNRSLIVGIAGGSPKRAAALRFAEKGRQLLDAGAYQRALIYFEKALGLEANPYFYYYLARVHYHLAHMQESLRFLDVAESLLSGQSDWIAEVETLRTKFDAVARATRRNVRAVALPVR